MWGKFEGSGETAVIEDYSRDAQKNAKNALAVRAEKTFRKGTEMVKWSQQVSFCLEQCASPQKGRRSVETRYVQQGYASGKHKQFHVARAVIKQNDW